MTETNTMNQECFCSGYIERMKTIVDQEFMDAGPSITRELIEFILTQWGLRFRVQLVGKRTTTDRLK